MRIAMLAVLAATLLATPAAAQEIVVTASRRAEGAPAVSGVGIKRRADFAVMDVRVYGDSRDKAQRRKEILDTVRAAIELGARRGVQLAYGQEVIKPLTLANYADTLKFIEDSDRDDAEQVDFFIKAPLDGPDALAAIDKLSGFVKAVPKVGRAAMETEGEAGISIVNPSQYRAQIIAAIAGDATGAAQAFGPGYAASVDGLARPVRWVLTGPTEVLLYIDHELSIVPRRGGD